MHAQLTKPFPIVNFTMAFMLKEAILNFVATDGINVSQINSVLNFYRIFFSKKILKVKKPY